MAVSTSGGVQGRAAPRSPKVREIGVPFAAPSLARALLNPPGCSPMTRRLAWLLSLSGLAAAWLPAACFTSPINQHPTVDVVPAAVPIARGKEARFMVSVSDPDGDPVAVNWGLAPPDSCPNNPGPQSWPGGSQRLQPNERTFMVDGGVTRSVFCVCVFAVDSHNAVDGKCLLQTPSNAPPDARLKVVSPDDTLQPFPLFSSVHLSAAETTDPEMDPITYAWKLSRPLASTATLTPCQMGADPNLPERCFFADSPGTYVATVEAQDGFDRSSAPATVQIAEDRLPCIRATRPLLTSLIYDDNASAPQSIFVDGVDDDGNPYPGNSQGVTHFAWYVGSEGGPMSYLGNDVNSFAPVRYHPGDVVRVRVEIRDRNVATIDRILTGCQLSGDALCESPAGSGCFLSVTWTVRFNT